MDRKTIIYVFGNPLLKEDRLPLDILGDLNELFPEIDFVYKDPNENIWPENGELMIIDTAVGIDKVTVFNSLGKIAPEKFPYSLHDFDLALNLKLLEKIGKLKKVTIFAVPQNISKEEALAQLSKEIENFISN